MKAHWTESVHLARLHLVGYASGHTWDELMQEALNEAEKLSDSSIGFCHFVARDERTLSHHTWSTRTRADSIEGGREGHPHEVADAGIWADCLRERGPVVHNGSASPSSWRGLPPGPFHARRELAAPVLRSGRIVAVLGVGDKSQDYFHESERRPLFGRQSG